jgi:acetyl/propionyl-CoA carboxylase alpha subunit
VESRIYAEDPYRNFRLHGRVVRYRLREGVRSTPASTRGGNLDPYDPMIAKLVGFARPDGDKPLEALVPTIGGVTHNVGFLSAVLARPRPLGPPDDNYIAEEFPGIRRRHLPDGTAAFAPVAAFVRRPRPPGTGPSAARVAARVGGDWA